MINKWGSLNMAQKRSGLSLTRKETNARSNFCNLFRCFENLDLNIWILRQRNYFFFFLNKRVFSLLVTVDRWTRIPARVNPPMPAPLH